jgi:hypothetical protein
MGGVRRRRERRTKGKGLVLNGSIMYVVVPQVNYVQEMNLGGVFVWAADLDDFKGVCGVKWPLLSTINRHLRGKNLHLGLSNLTV